MNQRGLTRTGDFAVGAYITASDIGFPDSMKDLTEILRTLNSEAVLVILAGINYLIQQEDLPVTDIACQRAFCSPILQAQIAYKNPVGHFIFGRQSTLHLLTEVACLFDAHSKSDMNQTEVKNKLARSYLIVNGLSEAEEPDSLNDLEMDGEDEQAALRRDVMVDFIPLWEYRIRPLSSRGNSELLVRAYELLRRLEKTNTNVDVNRIFYQATGLTLRNYYHLILLVVSKYLNLSVQEILEGESLFIDFKGSPDLKPLYDKLLPHTCISVNTLADEAAKSTSLRNEFRLWRQYPLVKMTEDRIICVDITFLLDKLQSGIFWIIRDQLETRKRGDGQKIISLWGDVFEDYAASIVKRGINSQTPSMEKCILNPKYIGKDENECTDIAVYGDDTLILLECKAPLLRAEVKFSGDFGKLRQEILTKLVETKNKRGKVKIKGVVQLWDAIQTLGHTNKKKRRRVERIDISKVTKIYPVLVLFDRVFGSPCMNWFLNSEFQRFVNRNALKKHLEIMPLTVLTIDHLEQLEPCLNDTPFYTHLDRWLQQFERNPVRGFGEYAYSLHEHTPRENRFMSQQFDGIKDEAYEYFTALGANL